MTPDSSDQAFARYREVARRDDPVAVARCHVHIAFLERSCPICLPVFEGGAVDKWYPHKGSRTVPDGYGEGLGQGVDPDTAEAILDEEPSTEEFERVEQPVTRRVVIRGGRTVEVTTYPAMETR